MVLLDQGIYVQVVRSQVIGVEEGGILGPVQECIPNCTNCSVQRSQILTSRKTKTSMYWQ